MIKLHYLAIFMLIWSALMPISYAHLEEMNTTCTVGDNFTIIPNANLTIAVESNTTVNFLMQSILTGDCSAFFMHIQTDCTWCAFSDTIYNQTHGSNKPINSIVYVPPLHPNLTNTTYHYLINFTEIPENINYSKNVTFRNFDLGIFVPYTDQFINVTNLTNVTSLGVQDVLNLISNMTADDQVQLALVLSSVFDDLNFSFIVRERDVQVKNVPIISPIPLNLEEYLKWSRSCIPDIYEQAQAKAVDLQTKYNDSLTMLDEIKLDKEHLRDEIIGCKNTINQIEFSKQQEIEDGVKQSSLDADKSKNTMYAVAGILIATMVYLYYKTHFGISLRKKKPVIPHKTMVIKDEEPDESIGERIKEKVVRKKEEIKSDIDSAIEDLERRLGR